MRCFQGSQTYGSRDYERAHAPEIGTSRKRGSGGCADGSPEAIVDSLGYLRRSPDMGSLDEAHNRVAVTCEQVGIVSSTRDEYRGGYSLPSTER